MSERRMLDGIAQRVAAVLQVGPHDARTLEIMASAMLKSGAWSLPPYCVRN